MINLEASKTLLTFVLQRYLKLCRAMQCVAELPLLYRYLHLYKSNGGECNRLITNKKQNI